MSIMNYVKRSYWFATRVLRGTRYKQLFEEINKCKPANIMEIGTWNGNTALKMIESASKYRSAPNINYYGFDMFENLTEKDYLNEISKHPPSLKTVAELLSSTGANIKLYKGNTHDTLPKYLPELPKMDFVFIDGGHSIETIRNDWNQISDHIADNGVVIFDDYWVNKTDHGCKPILDSIDTARFRVELLPILDNYLNKNFGRLSIKLAKVTRIADARLQG
jgi:predicted O-methyltransferase YrrM